MKKKKILLFSDDLRMSSGVGTMSREIVLGTAHHFDWVQVGGAINHPEAGKMFDLSSDINYWETLKSKSIITECNLSSNLASKYDVENSTTFEEFENLYQNAVLNFDYVNLWKEILDTIVPDKSKTLLCVGTWHTVFAKMKTVLGRPMKNIL